MAEHWDIKGQIACLPQLCLESRALTCLEIPAFMLQLRHFSFVSILFPETNVIVLLVSHLKKLYFRVCDL